MNESIPMLEQAPEALVPEQIAYCVQRKPKWQRGIPMRVRLALAMALCVAVVLCRILRPDAAGELRRWVVGDGSEQVQQAFFGMEQALEEGGGLGEAWAVFQAELSDAAA